MNINVKNKKYLINTISSLEFRKWYKYISGQF